MLTSTTNLLASIDPKKLREYFEIEDLKSPFEDNTNNDWENWDDFEIEGLSLDIGTFPWDECLISVNRNAGFLVISRQTQTVIAEFDKDLKETNYILLNNEQKEDGIITMNKCLDVEIDPNFRIKSKKKKNCIHTFILGFSTGVFKIYDSKGEILLTQHLDSSPILKIKLRINSLYLSWSEQKEELIFLHGQNVLVSIDGFTLFTSINYNYSQIKTNNSTEVKGVSLSYRKWKLSGQKQINDFISCGIKGNTEFSILNSLQKNPRFFAVGKMPFLGSYLENEESRIFSSGAEREFSITNTIKKSVFSFATGWFDKDNKEKNEQSQKQQKKKKKFEPPVDLDLNWKLNDPKREVNRIYMAPNSRFAVITDNFGRVLLLDTINFLIIRIWKGYREAQCAWIEIPIRKNLYFSQGRSKGLEGFVKKEQRNKYQLKRLNKKPISKRKIILVIYAPNRNLVETWSLPHIKIKSSFKVKPNCLLFSNFGTLGSTLQQEPSRAFLFETKSGNLSEIIVKLNPLNSKSQQKLLNNKKKTKIETTNNEKEN
ncbi:rab3-gap regulatory domain [Anaeramoeba flamelloides]|uniref:Rab3-gap regulatory domain n=1 Tax=Anaeramoeba flamelloides TaxID=1746091 RepID=A0ABQ8XDA1_9EUKA|nr:rab3-gap regulatory domain [Anaeramoeba flamelloides]